MTPKRYCTMFIQSLQQFFSRTEQRLLSDPEPLRTSAKGQILLLEVRREMEALQGFPAGRIRYPRRVRHPATVPYSPPSRWC